MISPLRRDDDTSPATQGPTTSTRIPSLHYAPPPPRYQRRSFRRFLTVLFLLALVFTSWLLWPWAWLQLRFWYWQRQCVTYVAPVDHMVCEEGASWGGFIPPFISTAVLPRPLAEMEKLGVSGSVLPVGPVIYMGERRTPGGQRRLLVIRRLPPAQRQSWDAPMGLNVAQWHLRPLFHADLGMTSALYADPFPQTFDADASFTALRIFAGRTDPDDPTRFTIDFETPDGRQTMEGLLRDSKRPAVEPVVEWTIR